MPSPAEIVEQYFDAWTSKDFETARSLLHDDLSFVGPIEKVDHADALIRVYAARTVRWRGIFAVHCWIVVTVHVDERVVPTVTEV